MMQKYILPVLTALILVLFFSGMPELDRVPVVKLVSSRSIEYKNAHRKKRIDRIDVLLMATFTLVFGIIDFAGLGNRVSVETFADMEGTTTVFSLEEPAVPGELHLFSGVGYGVYSIEFSSDGISYDSCESFMQDAGEVLRWNTVYPIYSEKCSYLRVSCHGTAWLGEVCFLDSEMNQIPLSCPISELTDEQNKLCREYSYMNSTYFDEIYHARTAWEHLNNVFPYEISHPPLGKLIIALGISLFGMTPFGWRFSGVLFGVLMLPIMYIFLKKLFGSRRVSAAGTLVFATDFMHFVQTRIATIDTYSVFFILLMYLFMYIYISEEKLWSLALSGICFGLGAASKWTSIYAGAGLAVIWGIYHIINREKGIQNFLRNSLFCFVFFVLVPCLIYYISYLPYGTAQGITNIFSREYMNIVLENQQYMFSYHSNLIAEHPYSSVWYQWLLDIRPILYYLNYFSDGTRSSFGAFVNPMLCWGGLLALFVLIYEAFFRLDRDALFILIGYFSQLVPWMFVTRLTFEYHYFPCTVFLVLAVSYIFRLMENRTKRFKLFIWGFPAVSLALFLLFYPALSGYRVDNSAATRIFSWLPTWPF